MAESRRKASASIDVCPNLSGKINSTHANEVIFGEVDITVNTLVGALRLLIVVVPRLTRMIRPASIGPSSQSSLQPDMARVSLSTVN